MALRWIEGWEAFNNATSAGRIYDNASGTIGQGDGASIAADEAAIATTPVTLRTPELVATDQGSWIIGFAFRPNRNDDLEFGGADPTSFAFRNADGEQCRIELYDDDPAQQGPGMNYYRVRLMRGATELCASNQAWLVNSSDSSWIYFEFKVTIDNSSGSIEGRYKYVRKASATPSTVAITWDAANTSLDTQDQSSTNADRIEFYWANSVLDDIYFCDDTGARNNDYLGRIIVVPQKPSGDGDTTDWDLAGGAVSTQQAWDQAVTAPSSTDDDRRMSSDTSTEIHLAAMDAIPSDIESGATVVGVRQDWVGRMETAGDLDIEHYYRKTTATAGQTAGASKNLNSTGWVGSSDVTEDDPNTASAWSYADLDTYQHGVRNAG